MTDRALMFRFESLGDNCELGLVQRSAGAEPLGLLRFAGCRLSPLVRALNARFAGIEDEIKLFDTGTEYMVRMMKYDAAYHSFVRAESVDADVFLEQQTRIVGYLARKLLDDIEDAKKVFVFRQNEPMSINDLDPLRHALSAIGPAQLLWVREGDADHPPGSVVVVDDLLMIGHVTRLAHRARVPEFDRASWVEMLRNATETSAPIAETQARRG